ncbi:MAG TPA: pitrilysin family protein [Ktedonobacteraceae bacterium]|jgi:predicted Zn-dependent peptidase|nr:pitrilysin family protein [Ktedonobacteraceae bacterium]
MQYKRTTLGNGLRLLTAPIPNMRSASIALFFTVGSRYESRSIAGISHFIEHMLFKGTRSYPSARHISEAIEGVGGSFNGTTSKELTSYTARVPGEHLEEVLHVLADMVRRPLFDPEELEKERNVIIEEIRSTKDDPQEWASLLIDEIMWPGLELGRDDAGFEETVAQIQRDQMLAYLDEYYRSNGLVISVAGNIDEEAVLDLVSSLFGDWQPGRSHSYTPCLPPVDAAPVAIITRATEQVNLCLGTLGISYASPDYYAFMLANAILGDGMSSRLFQNIREERGLAYDIGSYFNSYAETGNFVVSAGIDATQTEATTRAIIEELARLCETPVAPDELARIKAYICGSMLLGMEGTHQVASWLGSQESLRSDVLDIDRMIALIEAVTPQDIQRVAQVCFDPQWRRLAIIGPYKAKQAERLAKLLQGGL